MLTNLQMLLNHFSTSKTKILADRGTLKLSENDIFCNYFFLKPSLNLSLLKTLKHPLQGNYLSFCQYSNIIMTVLKPHNNCHLVKIIICDFNWTLTLTDEDTRHRWSSLELNPHLLDQNRLNWTIIAVSLNLFVLVGLSRLVIYNLRSVLQNHQRKWIILLPLHRPYLLYTLCNKNQMCGNDNTE